MKHTQRKMYKRTDEEGDRYTEHERKTLMKHTEMEILQ